MIKVISVFGTRPDTIKMAPLVALLDKDESFEHIVCVTGQHREMVKQILEVFDINPKYDLDIMKQGRVWIMSLLQYLYDLVKYWI